MDLPKNVLVRPGTVILAVIILGMGTGLYSWSSNYLDDAGESSGHAQDKLLKCSELNIDVLNVRKNSSEIIITFKTNMDSEKVYVKFLGNKNVTKTSESVEEDSINRLNASMDDLYEARLKVDECSQVFRHETGF